MESNIHIPIAGVWCNEAVAGNVKADLLFVVLEFEVEELAPL
jgi:hypothetical protein